MMKSRGWIDYRPTFLTSAISSIEFVSIPRLLCGMVSLYSDFLLFFLTSNLDPLMHLLITHSIAVLTFPFLLLKSRLLDSFLLFFKFLLSPFLFSENCAVGIRTWLWTFKLLDWVLWEFFLLSAAQRVARFNFLKLSKKLVTMDTGEKILALTESV